MLKIKRKDRVVQKKIDWSHLEMASLLKQDNLQAGQRYENFIASNIFARKHLLAINH